MSIVMYASETWTEKEKQHIQTTETEVLTHMNSYPLMNQNHNGIRTKLDILSTNDKIEESSSGWRACWCVYRKDHQSLVKSSCILKTG